MYLDTSYFDMILAGRRSNYLDEEDPAQDDSHSPARDPSLQAVYFGKLPVVPIGDTGTIPFAMRQNARDCVDAAFDTSEGSGDGSRWWYINTWALSLEKWKRDLCIAVIAFEPNMGINV